MKAEDNRNIHNRPISKVFIKEDDVDILWMYFMLAHFVHSLL